MRIYEVFARKARGDALRHIGTSMRRMTSSPASTRSARTTKRSWFDMWVVPRDQLGRSVQRRRAHAGVARWPSPRAHASPRSSARPHCRDAARRVRDLILVLADSKRAARHALRRLDPRRARARSRHRAAHRWRRTSGDTRGCCTHCSRTSATMSSSSSTAARPPSTAAWQLLDTAPDIVAGAGRAERARRYRADRAARSARPFEQLHAAAPARAASCSTRSTSTPRTAPRGSGDSRPRATWRATRRATRPRACCPRSCNGSDRTRIARAVCRKPES